MPHSLAPNATYRDLPLAAKLADGVGLVLTLAGETLGGFLLPGRTVALFSPLFLCGVSILVLRHLVWTRPTILRVVPRAHRDSGVREGLVLVTRAAVATRVLVLTTGLLAAGILGYTLQLGQPRLSHNELWNLPARFDAGWYLGIARGGYEWNPELVTRQQSVAFFPLYPALVRVAGDLVTVPAKVMRDPGLFGNGNTRVLWGGVLVSIFCFVFAARKLYLIGLDSVGGSAAKRASILFVAYPFAIFFSAAYSEGLFVLCLCSTVLSWRRGEFRAAFWWGVATGLARSNGWTVSLALVADALLSRRGAKSVVAGVGPLAGMGLFSAYIYRLTGHPLQWATAQEAWGRTFAPSAFVARRADAIVDYGLSGYLVREPVDAATAAAVLLAIAMAIVLLARREWLFAGLALVYLAPAVAIDLPASGRMTAVLFPTFLALASLTTRRWLFVGIAAAFLIGQCAMAVLHYTWRPPF